jgi:hypothetical protein
MEGSEKLTEAEEEEGTGGDYAFMLSVSVRQGKDGGIFFCEEKKKTCVHMRGDD